MGEMDLWLCLSANGSAAGNGTGIGALSAFCSAAFSAAAESPKGLAELWESLVEGRRSQALEFLTLSPPVALVISATLLSPPMPMN